MTGLHSDASRSAGLSRLAALLRTGGRAFHGSGCACCGRGPTLVDPNAVDLDVIGCLAARYRRDGRSELADQLDRWIESPGTGLVARLNGGGTEDLPATVRSLILADVLAVLEAACQGLSTGERE